MKQKKKRLKSGWKRRAVSRRERNAGTVWSAESTQDSQFADSGRAREAEAVLKHGTRITEPTRGDAERAGKARCGKQGRTAGL